MVEKRRKAARDHALAQEELRRRKGGDVLMHTGSKDEMMELYGKKDEKERGRNKLDDGIIGAVMRRKEVL